MLFLVRSEFITKFLLMGVLLLQLALAWGLVAEERVDQILCVNRSHPQTSDPNSGSQILPFKTISKAAAVAEANNARNVSTKIPIAANIYREENMEGTLGLQSNLQSSFSTGLQDYLESQKILNAILSSIPLIN